MFAIFNIFFFIILFWPIADLNYFPFFNKWEIVYDAHSILNSFRPAVVVNVFKLVKVSDNLIWPVLFVSVIDTYQFNNYYCYCCIFVFF